MLEAGSGFCFATKALQMRFSRPMAKADHFQCDRAIETSLPGTIYNTLATAADLVEQFIIAEVGQRLCQTRSLFNLGRSSRITRFNIFNGAAVIRLRRSYGGRVVAAKDGRARRSSPVSNRQAVQSPSGASARTSAPHFRQSLSTLLIMGESFMRSPSCLLREILSYVTLATQRSNGAAHLRYRWQWQQCG